MNILIIDDELGYTKLARIYILDFLADTNLDATVELATDMEQARDAFSKGFNPDVIVLDLYLPKTSGRTAIDDIPSLRSDASVIVLTGNNDDANIDPAFANGATDFLHKKLIDHNHDVLGRSVYYAFKRLEYARSTRSKT